MCLLILNIIGRYKLSIPTSNSDSTSRYVVLKFSGENYRLQLEKCLYAYRVQTIGTRYTHDCNLREPCSSSKSECRIVSSKVSNWSLLSELFKMKQNYLLLKWSEFYEFGFIYNFNTYFPYFRTCFEWHSDVNWTPSNNPSQISSSPTVLPYLHLTIREVYHFKVSNVVFQVLSDSFFFFFTNFDIFLLFLFDY